ncbi:MAG: hypothetical protein JXA81_08780 [Sedimentisphaerales bacterium]|nr:hypothetical protein [Sedimentisphaerales bacterium]
MRITSIVAAILAGVFFVFPVIYGVRTDNSIDKFLKLPSAKEKFENAADTKTKTGESQESPLVKQAEAFALYLNPDKPAVAKTPKGIKTTTNIDSKVTVTPKFPVLATIFYPENPTLSQALIDEPGRGRHWVRQSSMVGHLFVEQVKDGLVVLKSSEETYNLEIQEKAETGLPAKASPASSLRSSPGSVKPTSTAFSRAAANVRNTRSIPQRTQRNIDDDEKVNEFVDKLKDLQQSSASDKTDSKIDKEERNARIQELISKYKSTRVSAEEAEKLDNMGEELNAIQEDPNLSSPEADEDQEDQEDAGTSESDKSAEK